MQTLLVVGLAAMLVGGCGSANGAKHDGGGGGAGGGPQDFPSTAIFYQDISQSPVDSEWNGIVTGTLNNGWGGKLGIDVSFSILTADASVTPRPFTQPQSARPDCDTAPIPVPPGGHIEGEANYICSSGGDCHLLVYQGSRLYELYQASITGGTATGGTFTGTCLVVWDLTRDYWSGTTPGPNYSRGDGCNGADAGDLPMATLILNTSDIQSGTLNHALRFTIGNSLIRAGVYLHPATHLGGPQDKTNTSMPYGSRLRLKASYDETKLSAPAQIVARGLKKYGMFLADGGSPFISATDDIASVISPSALSSLQPTDFEMVDGGTRININQFKCMRTPITQ